jgi:energy-converting hydrogenase Eha subunit C
MCLSVFPYILEDEGQRMTAQQAGLTDIVLRGMVLFPDSVRLHTAAFHTIVLLARPIGGKEGMLFHSSMVNSSGIFGGRTRSGRNGIAVMLDSMQRFALEPSLQAMSCWSMVNIALAPSQKTVLVKLGGIGAIASAMLQHPLNAEVQFRSLFALINLVIPCKYLDVCVHGEAVTLVGVLIFGFCSICMFYSCQASNRCQ